MVTTANQPFQIYQQVDKHSQSLPHQIMNVQQHQSIFNDSSGQQNQILLHTSQATQPMMLNSQGMLQHHRLYQNPQNQSSMTIEQNANLNIKQETQGFDITQSLNSQSLEEDNDDGMNQQQQDEIKLESVGGECDYRDTCTYDQSVDNQTIEAFNYQGIKNEEDQLQSNIQNQVKDHSSYLLSSPIQNQKQQPATMLRFSGISNFKVSTSSAFGSFCKSRLSTKEEEKSSKESNANYKLKALGTDNSFFNVSDNILKMLEQEEEDKTTSQSADQRSTQKQSQSTSFKRSANNKLLKVTLGLIDLIQKCNPLYVYQPLLNPKRDLTQPSEAALNNGYDNSESDYILRVGEYIITPEERYYEILDLMGKGTFGQVVKCECKQNKETVAIKVIKNKKAFKNQGVIEIKILDILNRVYDPNGEAAVVRMLDFFVFRNHLCIVFELLSASLYDMLKETQFNGVSLNFSRLIISKILEGMKVLKEARLIHCDLKPENILFKTKENVNLKIIDVGSACFEGHEIFQYIQSRYYRSPEVILGLPYDSGIDMWSLGCICAELFLGIPIFPGNSEYDQLSKIIEILGLPPQHMIARAKFKDKYFVFMPEYQQFRFKTFEEFQITNGIRLEIPKRYIMLSCLDDLKMKFYQKKTMEQMTLAQKDGKEINPQTFQPRIPETEVNTLEAFIDFLKGVLRYEKENRWSPNMAMTHPFIARTVYEGHYEPSRDLDRRSTTETFDESMSERSPSSRDSKDYKAGSCPSKILYPATASVPQYLLHSNANFQPVFMANQKRQQQPQMSSNQSIFSIQSQSQNLSQESSIESHRPPILSIPDDYFKGFMFNKLDQILSMTKDQLVQFVYEQNEINYRQQQQAQRLMLMQQQNFLMQQQQLINQCQIPINAQGFPIMMAQMPLVMGQMPQVPLQPIRQQVIGSQPDMMGMGQQMQMGRSDLMMGQFVNPQLQNQMMILGQPQMQGQQMNPFMGSGGMPRMIPNESIILNPPPYHIQKSQLTNADAQNDPNFFAMQQQRMMAFKNQQRNNNQGKPGSWQPPQGMKQQKYNQYYNQMQNPGQLIGRQNEMMHGGQGTHHQKHNHQQPFAKAGVFSQGFGPGKNESMKGGSITTSKDFKKLKEKKSGFGVGSQNSRMPASVIIEETDRSQETNSFQPSTEHLEEKKKDSFFSIFKDNFKPQYHNDYQPINYVDPSRMMPNPSQNQSQQQQPSPKIMSGSLGFLQKQKAAHNYQNQSVHSRNQSINNNNSGGGGGFGFTQGNKESEGGGGFNHCSSFVSNYSSSKGGQGGEKGFLKKFENQASSSQMNATQGQDNQNAAGQKTFINNNHHINQHSHLHRGHLNAAENTSHHKQSMSQILSSSINHGSSQSFHQTVRSRADSDQVINDESGSNSADLRSNEGKQTTSKLSINLNSEQADHNSSQTDLLSTKSRKAIQFDDLKDQILRQSQQQQNSFMIMQNQQSARGQGGDSSFNQSNFSQGSMPTGSMSNIGQFGSGSQKRGNMLPIPSALASTATKPPVYSQPGQKNQPIPGFNPFNVNQIGVPLSSQQFGGSAPLNANQNFQRSQIQQLQQDQFNEQMITLQTQLTINMQKQMVSQNEHQLLQRLKYEHQIIYQQMTQLAQRAQVQQQQQLLLQQHQPPLIKHGRESSGSICISLSQSSQGTDQRSGHGAAFKQRENSGSFKRLTPIDEDALSHRMTTLQNSYDKNPNLPDDHNDQDGEEPIVQIKEEEDHRYIQAEDANMNSQYSQQLSQNQIDPMLQDMLQKQMIQQQQDQAHAQYQMFLMQQQQQQQQMHFQGQNQQNLIAQQQQQALMHQMRMHMQQQQQQQQMQGGSMVQNQFQIPQGGTGQFQAQNFIQAQNQQQQILPNQQQFIRDDFFNRRQ